MLAPSVPIVEVLSVRLLCGVTTVSILLFVTEMIARGGGVL